MLMSNSISSYVHEIVSTTDFTAPLSYTFQAGDQNNSSFYLREGTDSTFSRYAYGNLSARSVTIVEAGAVPEPATWTMLIVGFGLVGGVMRRRQKAGVRYA